MDTIWKGGVLSYLLQNNLRDFLEEENILIGLG